MAITINGSTGISGVDGSASAPALQGADTNTGMFFPAADTVAVTTGGAERMRVDSSGNVGIGTSSPAYKLDVNGFARGAIIQKLGTYTPGSTTPSVSGVTFMSISNSSATTISNFIGNEEGQIIYLFFNDSNTTVNRSNAYLKDSTNFVSTSSDTLVLLKVGSFWYELSRSNNG
jgi:hypothetical protein